MGQTVPDRLLGTDHDIDQAFDCFQKATEITTDGPRQTFLAFSKLAELCDDKKANLKMHVYEEIMLLLPQLLWLGITIDTRYRNIVDIGGICAEAVSAAISLEDHQKAIEWLEEGRSIVWKQMLQLRDPFDNLTVVDSTLSAELKQVARELDYGSSYRTVNSSNISSQDDTGQRYHRLAERWGELVDRVRHIPDFEGFMRPKKAAELVLSAQSGPVVMINVGKARCDALVIIPGSTEILHTPLMDFSHEKAAKLSAQWQHLVGSRGSIDRAYIKKSSPNDEFGKALAVIWEDIVKPVLEVLGYLVCPTRSLCLIFVLITA